MRAAVFTLALATLGACAGRPGVPDRWQQLPAAAAPAFDAGDVPYASSGAPLRGPAVEGEWRMHLGAAHRSGTRLAPGIADPRIRWSAEVGIQGYANTPLVGAARVFATSQGDMHNSPDAADGFYAVDRMNGDRLWFYATNEDVNGGLLTDRFVIGGTDDGTLYAVHRDDGELAWRVELGEPLHHAPIEAFDRLWVLGRETLLALDPRDGAELGRIRVDGGGWESRGALAANETGLVLTTRNARVAHVSPDGELSWSAALGTQEADGGYTATTYAPPVLLGERVLVAAPDVASYGSFRLRVALLDVSTGRPDWDVTGSSGLRVLDGAGQAGAFYEMPFYAASPWLMNGRAWVPLLAVDAVVAFDAADGEPATAFPTRGCSSRQFPSIVGVPSRGYLVRHEGSLFAFEPATGRVVWGMRLGVHANAGAEAPIATARQRNAGYCEGYPYDGSGLFATPAVGDDGTLYVGTGDGWLYAVDDPRWERAGR